MERSVDFEGEKAVKSSVLGFSETGGQVGINPEKEAKYGLQVD